jgi:hypothetical protein
VKLHQFVLIHAIISIILGIAFALYGPIMVRMFGILDFPGAEGALYWFTTSFARLLGALLFGFGFLLWAVRDMLSIESLPAEKAQRTALALLLGTVMVSFVAVTQQWQVWVTLAGWVTIALYIFLTLGYTYFLATRKY